LEGIHQTSETISKTKQYLLVLCWIIPFIVLLSFFIVFRLRKVSKGKEQKLEQVENKLIQKQNTLKKNLIQKIEDTKALQASTNKKTPLAQRDILDKELYNNSLHLNEWEKFVNLMNLAFNNIISVLESNYPEITKKEITYCCLSLLEVHSTEIALLLECKQDSLYKLKSRLAQKMNLKSTKALDLLLEKIAEGK